MTKGSTLGHPPQIIDWRPKFFSVSEKQAIADHAFKLGKFRYVVRYACSQGDLTGTVKAMNLEGLDRGIWVNEELVKPVIDLLVARDGTPKQERLLEIDQRIDKLRQSEPPQQVVPSSQKTPTTESMAPKTGEMPVPDGAETDALLIDLLKEWKKQPLKKKWDIPFKEIG